MSILDSKAAATAAGVLAAGVVLYLAARAIGGAAGDAAKAFLKGAGDAAKAVGNAVNPLSDKNLAAGTVNTVGSKITGDEHWTLGGAIYDIFHPYDPNRPTPRTAKGQIVRPEDKPSSLR